MKKYLVVSLAIMVIIACFTAVGEHYKLNITRAELKGAYEKLKIAENEAQEARQLAAACPNDKNAEQYKQTIILQNQNLNTMRMEIEALHQKEEKK